VGDPGHSVQDLLQLRQRCTVPDEIGINVRGPRIVRRPEQTDARGDENGSAQDSRKPAQQDPHSTVTFNLIRCEPQGQPSADPPDAARCPEREEQGARELRRVSAFSEDAVDFACLRGHREQNGYRDYGQKRGAQHPRGAKETMNKTVREVRHGVGSALGRLASVRHREEHVFVTCTPFFFNFRSSRSNLAVKKTNPAQRLTAILRYSSCNQ
jgi:hypothetical protein